MEAIMISQQIALDETTENLIWERRENLKQQVITDLIELGEETGETDITELLRHLKLTAETDEYEEAVDGVIEQFEITL